jgi:hypothetical protein
MKRKKPKKKLQKIFFLPEEASTGPRLPDRDIFHMLRG